MKKIFRLSLLIALIATFVAMTSTASAQVSLGSAQSYGVLGSTTVTNTGPTVVTGNVGLSPGTSVTGFPPGTVVSGAIHAADGNASLARTDATAAYNAAAGLPCTADLTGQDLGGLILTPGVYCFSTSAQLTGPLTLNFQGSPNALFVFKIGSTLTTASGSSVLLTNNGGATCPANLFWQVGSSATLGTGTAFTGNILASSSITMNTGAILNGRALALNGAVTLSSNTMTACGPLVACPVITLDDTLPDGVVGGVYTGAVLASGGTVPYTYALTSGSLPTGLGIDAAGNITGTPTGFGTFNFSITATDANGCFGTRAYDIVIASAGCSAIVVAPTTLPPAVAGSYYSATVSASGGTGPYTFSVIAGSLPPGLVLNSASGAITGTPSTNGLYSFTIQAADSLNCLGSRAYTTAVGVYVPPIPALGLVGFTLLVALLAGVGLFVMKGFTS
jgi:hypothetical protein